MRMRSPLGSIMASAVLIAGLTACGNLPPTASGPAGMSFHTAHAGCGIDLGGPLPAFGVSTCGSCGGSGGACSCSSGYGGGCGEVGCGYGGDRVAVGYADAGWYGDEAPLPLYVAADGFPGRGQGHDRGHGKGWRKHGGKHHHGGWH